MLVVISMITIVTAVAFPKIKTIYEEFRINQTVEEFATLVSSYRSRYLIMNEFPADTGSGVLSNVDVKDCWSFPRNVCTASSCEFVLFTVKPYKGTNFDFSQFTTSDYWRRELEAVVLELNCISDEAVRDKYKEKLSNLYPKITFTTRDSGRTIGIPFLELTKECESEPGAHRNRYR